MGLPPGEGDSEDAAPTIEAPSPRPELHLIEARDARERKCADCGKRTATWKPVRRKGTPVILCLECAAKPPPVEGGCPECGAVLGPTDTFCGKCGARIEYACPNCGAALDLGDGFCGKCGAQVA